MAQVKTLRLAEGTCPRCAGKITSMLLVDSGNPAQTHTVPTCEWFIAASFEEVAQHLHPVRRPDA